MAAAQWVVDRFREQGRRQPAWCLAGFLLYCNPWCRRLHGGARGAAMSASGLGPVRQGFIRHRVVRALVTSGPHGTRGGFKENLMFDWITDSIQAALRALGLRSINAQFVFSYRLIFLCGALTA